MRWCNRCDASPPLSRRCSNCEGIAMTQPTITLREAMPRFAWALEQAGVSPLLARLFAARGVRTPDELDDGLHRLLKPVELRGATAAAHLLADALRAGKRIC